MAHGCGEGKIATTKSGWDRISGDLTIWSGKFNGTRCVSPGRRLELLAPTASLLRTVWAVSSCKRRPGETQRRDTTGDTAGKWCKMRKRWMNSDHYKADEIGLVGVWRFDLGNLMAHGCGKGKIATTKSRWDRISGDLTIWSGKFNGTRCVSPLCLSGEALGTARPHSFTAQHGLDSQQLQTLPRGDTTERHNGRHNRKMM